VATVTTESQPRVRTRSVVRSRAIAAVPLVLAAAAGGLVAVWAAYFLWPDGSHNLDELVYLNQAEAIRHGQLTYDTGSYVPDFRPYLSGVAGDRVVFKYQPLWSAWLALSQAATGDHRPGPLWAWVQDRPAGTMLDLPEGYDLGELPEARLPEAVIDTAVEAGGGRITSAWLRTLDAGGDELARDPAAASADPEPVAAWRPVPPRPTATPWWLGPTRDGWPPASPWWTRTGTSRASRCVG
jgi:hypothetical protein